MQILKFKDQYEQKLKIKKNKNCYQNNKIHLNLIKKENENRYLIHKFNNF